MMEISIEIIKFIIGLAALSVASVYDLKSREVPNEIWLFLIPVAIALTTAQIITARISIFGIILILIATGFSIVVFWIIFQVGFYGGADAKALIGIALLFPGSPGIADPILGSPFFIFPISVFANSVLINALVSIPTSLLLNVLWKLRTKQSLFEGFDDPAWRKAVALISCIKKSSRQLKPYDTLGERVIEKDGMKRKALILYATLQEENINTNVKPEGDVVVMFPVPMIPFILMGFLSSIFIGNIIFSGMSNILPLSR